MDGKVNKWYQVVFNGRVFLSEGTIFPLNSSSGWYSLDYMLHHGVHFAQFPATSRRKRAIAPWTVICSTDSLVELAEDETLVQTTRTWGESHCNHRENILSHFKARCIDFRVSRIVWTRTPHWPSVSVRSTIKETCHSPVTPPVSSPVSDTCSPLLFLTVPLTHSKNLRWKA